MNGDGSKELKIPGLSGQVAAKRWGTPSGHKVLALHGWLDNASTWDPIAPKLAKLNLMAVDLPGHGHSNYRPSGVHQHFVDWIPEVLEIAHALEWKRFSVMGHSMGGGIAALLAGTFPNRIEKLVLVDSTGPRSEPPEKAPERLKKLWVTHRHLQRPRLFSSLEEMTEVRTQIGTIHSNSARLLVERGAVKTGSGYRWRSDPRLRLIAPTRLTEEHVLAFLKNIQCPTLVVHGTEGIPLNDVHAKRIQTIPNVEVKALPGGHHLHMDHPEPVAQTINHFFEPTNAT